MWISSKISLKDWLLLDPWLLSLLKLLERANRLSLLLLGLLVGYDVWLLYLELLLHWLLCDKPRL